MIKQNDPLVIGGTIYKIMIDKGLYLNSMLIGEIKEELEVQDELKEQMKEMEGKKWMGVFEILLKEGKCDI